MICQSRWERLDFSLFFPLLLLTSLCVISALSRDGTGGTACPRGPPAAAAAAAVQQECRALAVWVFLWGGGAAH